MTLVIVHGLEGSSESQYVIGTGSKAWLAGMNVVRMNMRNCGDTEHLGPTLYNSSMSGDVGAIAKTLIAEDGLQKLAFVGYSMGGNLVLKLLGEWGADAPHQVKAAVGVSPAVDLAPSADALHNRANRVYEWKFLRGLRRRILRKAALFPDRYDVRHLRGLRSLRDFDDQITARYSGFRDAQDYYIRAAAARVVDRIAIPTLVLHALDDPFIRVLPETREKLQQNPHITFIETTHGGHCAFLAAPNGYDGRWAERQAIAFIQRIESAEPVRLPHELGFTLTLRWRLAPTGLLLLRFGVECAPPAVRAFSCFTQGSLRTANERDLVPSLISAVVQSTFKESDDSSAALLREANPS